MTETTSVHAGEGKLSIGIGMFTIIGRGYATAVLLGVAGYTMFDGPVWSWLLFVWIAGAPITLFFIKLVRKDRMVGKTITVTRGDRFPLWRFPSLMRMTRFGNDS